MLIRSPRSLPTQRRILLACFQLVAICCAAFGSAPARCAEPVVHLLIVADTLDGSIGKSVESDIAMIDEAFRGNVPERQLRIRKLAGADLSPQRWLREIGELRPAENDTLVVYFSGHGAWQANGGHLFTPRGQMLRREQVAEAIRQRGMRLGVLIGDCCSQVIQVPIPVPFAPPVEEVTPLFDALFLKPRGFVDISATRPGELAMCTDGGGVFTIAFHLLCIDSTEQRLTWGQALDKLNAATRRMYPRQTAYAVKPLPAGQVAAIVPPGGDGNGGPGADGGGGGNGGQPGRRLRLGITGIDNDQGARHGGVAIQQVIANMPATRLRLAGGGAGYRMVPGRDVITHVNGTPVRTNAELVAAVYASPQTIRLTIYDGLTRRTADYLTELE